MKRFVSAPLLVLFLLTWAGTATAATPEPLWKSCPTGAGAGECRVARAVVANPDTGNVYVIDGINQRVNVLSPWGAFRMAWGWGVRDGSSEPQVCGPEATPPSMSCQQGLPGGGPGQIDSAKGIAIDSAGNVYIYEASGGYVFNGPEQVFNGNNRVQKFGPDGEFLLAFGREVNLTRVAEREEQEANSEPVTVTAQEENLCTAASGDACGPGTRGSGDGEFGVGLPEFADIEANGDYIAVGPSDTIYVGGTERIQKFNSNGTFAGSLPDPDEVLVGEAVQSLAVDPVSGSIYISLNNPKDPGRAGSKAGVLKLSPSGASLATIPVEIPRALAVDTAGNLYAFDRENSPETHPSRVLMFDSAGALLTTFGEGDFDRSTGIAVSSACGLQEPDVYVANLGSGSKQNDFVAAYGPQPDPTICPPPPVAPTIAAQYATSVGTDAAVLGAEINPHFWPDATYYVEYGNSKCSEGGCQIFTAPSKLPGNGDFAIATKGVFLQGLTPNTTYHYRFVAQSAGGGPTKGTGDSGDGPEGTIRTFAPPPAPRTNCPNQAFRVGLSAKLPDCRAYEMVSPIDKNGGDIGVGPFAGHDLAAADGTRATYSSLRGFANPEAAPLQNQYISTRGSSGWETRSISPPRKLPARYPPGVPSQFKDFSEDLCDAWFVQDSDLALVAGAPAEVPNLYRRENCGVQPAYELLSPVQPPGGFEEETDSSYYVDPLGRSADGAHVVYRAPAPLTANACKTERIFQVYITSPGGPLRLVSSLPGNKANCTHSSAGYGGFNIAGTYDFRNNSVYHAVSEDGETVYWSAGVDALPVASGSQQLVSSPKLYVRVNATQPQSPLSSGQCTDPERACTLPVSEVLGSEFVAAAPNGASALYLAGAELFEYDLATGEPNSVAKGVTGVAGASEDLSRIYLISKEILSGQENSVGDVAQAGAPNLYLTDRADDSFTFIGTLAPVEANHLSETASAPATRQPRTRTSRLTPDGLHLAFTSFEPLTGYDNIDAASGQPDAEIYLYDADPAGGPGRLVCVSCNPSGARPRGAKVTSLVTESLNWMSGRLPGWPNQYRPSRLLSPDGDRLFFESWDGLVSADTNGRGDVYEWRRAENEAQCVARGAESYAVSAGGCLSLISSGRGAGDSKLLDASATGEDVFFTTAAGLLPQDPGLIDVYDARVGGGFPPPPAPPVACEGEACQGPVTTPESSNPASMTFQGAGNVREKAAHKKKGKKKHKKRHKKKSKKHQKRRAAR